MQKIEQVFVFVSQEKPISEKTVPSASSEGVLPIDLAEILEGAKKFCVPQDGHFELLNLFFHHLPSGRYAVGRLIPAFGERQKGFRVKSFYLHYMIVTPGTFLRFGNNPILLYQEILSNGQFPFITKPGETAEPILLDRPKKWFDIPLLKGMRAYPGAVPLAKLTETVLHSLCTVVSGGQQSLYVISALFNFFPIRFRPELTFTSGLFFEPDRLFRIIGTSGRPPKNSLIRDFIPDLPSLNLDKLAIRTDTVEIRHGWGKLILEILKSRRFDLLQTRLISYDSGYPHKMREGVPFIPSAGQLDDLGAKWLEEIRAPENSQQDVPNETAGRLDSEPETELKKKEGGKVFKLKKNDLPVPPPLRISEKLRNWLLSDSPEDAAFCFKDVKPVQPRFTSPLLLKTGKTLLFSPYQRLLAAYPKEEENLRLLDLLVTSVLNGDSDTLDQLTQFWSALLDQCDEDHRWRITEEYIHFIQIYITESDKRGEVGTPAQSAVALDLLNLFLNEGRSAEFSFDAD